MSWSTLGPSASTLPLLRRLPRAPWKQGPDPYGLGLSAAEWESRPPGSGFPWPLPAVGLLPLLPEQSRACFPAVCLRGLFNPAGHFLHLPAIKALKAQLQPPPPGSLPQNLMGLLPDTQGPLLQLFNKYYSNLKAVFPSL